MHRHVLTTKSQYCMMAGCKYFCEALNFGSGFKESFYYDFQNEDSSEDFTWESTLGETKKQVVSYLIVPEHELNE